MLWFKRRPLTEEELAMLRSLPDEGAAGHEVVAGRKRTVCRRLARMGYAKRTKWSQGGIRMYQRTPEGAALVTPRSHVT
jgi:hypothetical protein